MILQDRTSKKIITLNQIPKLS